MTGLNPLVFNPMEVKGVIFDMDGLMFDTERISRISYDYVEKRLGIDLRTGLPDMMGMNLKQVKQIQMEHFGPEFDFDGIRRMRMAYRSAYIAEHGLPVKPGLRELVAYLRQRGLKWTIATSTGKQITKNNLEIAGLQEDFPLMICGDMLEKSKPDPQIFYMAANLMDTLPQETVVLEDSYNGIKAAAAGGFITCMIPDLKQPDEEISSLIVRKFDTLLDVIPFLDTLDKKKYI